MKGSPPKKFLSFALSLLVFATNVVLPHAAETNIWSARRVALSSLGDVQRQIPRTVPILPAAATQRSLNILSKKSNPLTEVLLSQVVNIQSVHNAPSHFGVTPRTVVLLQDVHLNGEAQKNIARALTSLLSTDQLDKVGVEGAFDVFDFSEFRNSSNPKLTNSIAADFLSKNRLAAPSYVGIVNEQEPPLFVGIDDKVHYDKNVEALRTSLKEKASVQNKFISENSQLDKLKNEIFSKSLRTFDSDRSSYHQGTMGLGQYLLRLDDLAKKWGNGVPSGLMLAQFLEAYKLETRLDFKRVETERQVVLEALTKKLNANDLNGLMSLCLSFRLGKIGFGNFYSSLKSLCLDNGIQLHRTPHFDNYIRYVLLSDGVNGEKLFADIERLESELGKLLAVTSEEKNLLAESERHDLSKKLTEFSLTAQEWEKYQAICRGGSMPRPYNLSSFERFYGEADTRSEKMVENLLVGKGHVVALVVGGFHTPRITELLQQKNISYIVASPKITKLDDENGTSYLAAFAKEKTPLDKLFVGEKLFLAPTEVNIPDPVCRVPLIESIDRVLNPSLFSVRYHRHQLAYAFSSLKKTGQSLFRKWIPSRQSGRTAGEREFLQSWNILQHFHDHFKKNVYEPTPKNKRNVGLGLFLLWGGTVSVVSCVLWGGLFGGAHLYSSAFLSHPSYFSAFVFMAGIVFFPLVHQRIHDYVINRWLKPFGLLSLSLPPPETVDDIYANYQFMSGGLHRIPKASIKAGENLLPYIAGMAGRADPLRNKISVLNWKTGNPFYTVGRDLTADLVNTSFLSYGGIIRILSNTSNLRIDGNAVIRSNARAELADLLNNFVRGGKEISGLVDALQRDQSAHEFSVQVSRFLFQIVSESEMISGDMAVQGIIDRLAGPDRTYSALRNYLNHVIENKGNNPRLKNRFGSVPVKTLDDIQSIKIFPIKEGSKTHVFHVRVDLTSGVVVKLAVNVAKDRTACADILQLAAMSMNRAFKMDPTHIVETIGLGTGQADRYDLEKKSVSSVPIYLMINEWLDGSDGDDSFDEVHIHDATKPQFSRWINQTRNPQQLMTVEETNQVLGEAVRAMILYADNLDDPSTKENFVHPFLIYPNAGDLVVRRGTTEAVAVWGYNELEHGVELGELNPLLAACHMGMTTDSKTIFWNRPDLMMKAAEAAYQDRAVLHAGQSLDKTAIEKVRAQARQKFFHDLAQIPSILASERMVSPPSIRLDEVQEFSSHIHAVQLAVEQVLTGEGISFDARLRNTRKMGEVEFIATFENVEKLFQSDVSDDEIKMLDSRLVLIRDLWPKLSRESREILLFPSLLAAVLGFKPGYISVENNPSPQPLFDELKKLKLEDSFPLKLIEGKPVAVDIVLFWKNALLLKTGFVRNSILSAGFMTKLEAMAQRGWSLSNEEKISLVEAYASIFKMAADNQDQEILIHGVTTGVPSHLIESSLEIKSGDKKASLVHSEFRDYALVVNPSKPSETGEAFTYLARQMAVLANAYKRLQDLEDFHPTIKAIDLPTTALKFVPRLQRDHKHFSNIDDSDEAFPVAMGEFAVTRAGNSYTQLKSAHAADCSIVTIYSRSSQTGLLAHIPTRDQYISRDSLQQLIDVFGQDPAILANLEINIFSTFHGKSLPAVETIITTLSDLIRERQAVPPKIYVDRRDISSRGVVFNVGTEEHFLLQDLSHTVLNAFSFIVRGIPHVFLDSEKVPAGNPKKLIRFDPPSNRTTLTIPLMSAVISGAMPRVIELVRSDPSLSALAESLGVKSRLDQVSSPSREVSSTPVQPVAPAVPAIPSAGNPISIKREMISIAEAEKISPEKFSPEEIMMLQKRMQLVNELYAVLTPKARQVLLFPSFLLAVLGFKPGYVATGHEPLPNLLFDELKALPELRAKFPLVLVHDNTAVNVLSFWRHAEPLRAEFVRLGLLRKTEIFFTLKSPDLERLTNTLELMIESFDFRQVSAVSVLLHGITHGASAAHIASVLKAFEKKEETKQVTLESPYSDVYVAYHLDDAADLSAAAQLLILRQTAVLNAVYSDVKNWSGFNALKWGDKFPKDVFSLEPNSTVVGKMLGALAPLPAGSSSAPAPVTAEKMGATSSIPVAPKLITTSEDLPHLEKGLDQFPVAMGEYAVTKAGNAFEILSTYGASTCLVLTIYDPATKTGLMAHLLVLQVEQSQSSIDEMVGVFQSKGQSATELKIFIDIVDSPSALAYARSAKEKIELALRLKLMGIPAIQIHQSNQPDRSIGLDTKTGQRYEMQGSALIGLVLYSLIVRTYPFIETLNKLLKREKINHADIMAKRFDPPSDKKQVDESVLLPLIERKLPSIVSLYESFAPAIAEDLVQKVAEFKKVVVESQNGKAASNSDSGSPAGYIHWLGEQLNYSRADAWKVENTWALFYGALIYGAGSVVWAAFGGTIQFQPVYFMGSVLSVFVGGHAWDFLVRESLRAPPSRAHVGANFKVALFISAVTFFASIAFYFSPTALNLSVSLAIFYIVHYLTNNSSTTLHLIPERALISREHISHRPTQTQPILNMDDNRPETVSTTELQWNRLQQLLDKQMALSKVSSQLDREISSGGGWEQQPELTKQYEESIVEQIRLLGICEEIVNRFRAGSNRHIHTRLDFDLTEIEVQIRLGYALSSRATATSEGIEVLWKVLEKILETPALDDSIKPKLRRCEVRVRSQLAHVYIRRLRPLLALEMLTVRSKWDPYTFNSALRGNYILLLYKSALYFSGRLMPLISDPYHVRLENEGPVWLHDFYFQEKSRMGLILSALQEAGFAHQVISTIKSLPGDINSADFNAIQAEALTTIGKADEAFDLLNINKRPQDASWSAANVHALIALGKIAEAKAYLASLPEKSNDSVRIKAVKATLMFLEGHKQEALELLAERTEQGWILLEKINEFSVARLTLATLLYQVGNYAGASYLLDDSTEGYLQTNPRARIIKARALWRLQRPESALRQIARQNSGQWELFNILSSNIEVIYAFLDILYSAREKDQAIAQLAIALKKFPTDSHLLAFQSFIRAREYKRQNQYELALEILRKLPGNLPFEFLSRRKISNRMDTLHALSRPPQNGQTPASIFHVLYQRRLAGETLPFWKRIGSYLGEPTFMAPVWELVFPLILMSGTRSLIGFDIVSNLLMWTLTAVLFAMAHPRGRFSATGAHFISGLLMASPFLFDINLSQQLIGSFLIHATINILKLNDVFLRGFEWIQVVFHQHAKLEESAGDVQVSPTKKRVSLYFIVALLAIQLIFSSWYSTYAGDLLTKGSSFKILAGVIFGSLSGTMGALVQQESKHQNHLTRFSVTNVAQWFYLRARVYEWSVVVGRLAYAFTWAPIFYYVCLDWLVPDFLHPHISLSLIEAFSLPIWLAPIITGLILQWSGSPLLMDGVVYYLGKKLIGRHSDSEIKESLPTFFVYANHNLAWWTISIVINRFLESKQSPYAMAFVSLSSFGWAIYTTFVFNQTHGNKREQSNTGFYSKMYNHKFFPIQAKIMTGMWWSLLVFHLLESHGQFNFAVGAALFVVTGLVVYGIFYRRIGLIVVTALLLIGAPTLFGQDRLAVNHPKQEMNSQDSLKNEAAQLVGDVAVSIKKGNASSLFKATSLSIGSRTGVHQHSAEDLIEHLPLWLSQSDFQQKLSAIMHKPLAGYFQTQSEQDDFVFSICARLVAETGGNLNRPLNKKVTLVFQGKSMTDEDQLKRNILCRAVLQSLGETAAIKLAVDAEAKPEIQKLVQHLLKQGLIDMSRISFVDDISTEKLTAENVVDRFESNSETQGSDLLLVPSNLRPQNPPSYLRSIEDLFPITWSSVNTLVLALRQALVAA